MRKSIISLVALLSAALPPTLLHAAPLAPLEKLAPKARELPLDVAETRPPEDLATMQSAMEVVNPATLAGLPRVSAAANRHLLLQAGDRISAKGLQGSGIWYLYRDAGPIRDPRTKQRLGNELQRIGSARVLTTGEPATLEILESTSEIVPGAVLLRSQGTGLPVRQLRPAPAGLQGSIAAIYQQGLSAARNTTVAITLGKQQGLHAGDLLETTRPDGTRSTRMIVYRVFDTVSYALLSESHDAVTVGTPVVSGTNE